MEKEKLSKEERNFLILLGVPAFGLSLVYNLVTVYLPYFIERLSGAAVTGVMIGGEGVFALLIPFIVGIWSDSISTRLGKRLPFFIAGAVMISILLIVMPFSRNSLVLLGIELFLFFIGFFTLYEAYYTFFPDLVPLEERGRSQGIQGGFRAIGLLVALVGAGFMIQFWKPLPFILFTLLFILVAAFFTVKILKRIHPYAKGEHFRWYSEWDLVKNNRKIKLWIVANTLWEAAFSALKVFVVLYFIKGLSLTMSETSIAFILVSIAAVIAGPIAGKLADKYGHRPVILGSIVFFAVGLIPALFTTNVYFISCIMPVAFSAIVLMTLPFSMLMKYLPKEKQHGAGAALYGFCQGLGALAGPFTAGIAVELFKDLHVLVFAETDGYSAIFLIAALFLSASIPFTFELFKEHSKDPV